MRNRHGIIGIKFEGKNTRIKENYDLYGKSDDWMNEIARARQKYYWVN